MFDIPSRASLSDLATAARAIVPSHGVGLARPRDDGQLSVLYSHPHGVNHFIVGPAAAAALLAPGAGDIGYAGPDVIGPDPQRPIEWYLATMGVKGIVSMPARLGSERLWIGLTDGARPTDEALRAVQRVCEAASGGFHAPARLDDRLEPLRRLERTAALLPALQQVLDVSEVFERVSAISQASLPHDMLTLAMFDDNLTTMTMAAGTGESAPETARQFSQPYPAAVLEAWDFDILDDRSTYPFERDRPPTMLGMRSSLRLPFRFRGRVMGGLGFHAREPFRYGAIDAAIGRRIGDHVGLAIYHHRLADEGRRVAASQSRTTSLDVLDALVHTIVDVLDVREALDRISLISQRALEHDALSIAIPSADGTRLTVFARTGALRHLEGPWEGPIADASLVQTDWEYRLVDDCLDDPLFNTIPSVQAGMRSRIIIPVRIEGRVRAWINFWSSRAARFKVTDVPVARRIAAHVALVISHQRLAERARLTEELRARTTNLELLDDLLAALTHASDLREVFERVSTIAGKVLAHDAVALLLRTADGHHHRAYASRGFPADAPEVTEVPEELIDNPDWEHDIFDDVSQLGARYAGLADMGFRSLLRVPILMDGRFAGALVFVSKRESAFKPADILVARRIADRVAVSLAGDRELQAARRAEEAVARAAKLEARVRALTDELDARSGYKRVIGESPQWRQVLTQATQVAATDTTVLLLGESGTGKEVIARFLHRGSTRNAGPFVALNCAALPEHLLEAELFGYERGAFTGAVQSKPGQIEQAAGGTLFLDEVGEMSLPGQAKFLRVLQEREFQRLGGTRVLRADVRVIAATNRDLQRAITQGQFREDLYYRLNVFALRLPALRDRREDILELSQAFLAEIGRGLGHPPGGISRDARALLLDYRWPGNVRELRNILERASILCDGGLITPEHLPIGLAAAARAAAQPSKAATVESTPPPVMPTDEASSTDLQAMERTMIEQALRDAKFNKSKAAKTLGLTRHQLYIRMRKHGFDV
jgi:transcriptional regulator with GAF, ATPase, and Fis domain